MFRCNHCKREYGGIRGITIDRTIDLCPRCTADSKSSPLSAPARAHFAAGPRRGRALVTAR